MPLYLDTRGNTSLAIAVCDRCSRKFPIGMLRPDGNSPGLRVCDSDWDAIDRWRLPARQPDRIALRFARPDVSIATDPAGIISEDGGAFVIAEDQDDYAEPG